MRATAPVMLRVRAREKRKNGSDVYSAYSSDSVSFFSPLHMAAISKGPANVTLTLTQTLHVTLILTLTLTLPSNLSHMVAIVTATAQLP